MKLVSSLIGGIGLAVGVSMMALGACGGDKSTVGGSGGATAAGGGGGGENTGGTGGTSSTGTDVAAGGSTSATGGTAASCTAKKVPDNGDMTNFADITNQNSDGSFGANLTDGTALNVKWGTNGLTGGTFFYQQDAADGVTAKIANEAAQFVSNIAIGHYSGFGLYYGPNSGSDACAFSGISFTILGTAGGATIDIQLQMNEDYPYTADTGSTCTKGTCEWEAAYADAGTSKWSTCTNPHTSIGVTVSTTVQTVQLTWDKFTGGKPVSALNCGTLLGLQFQFNCPGGGSAACTPDITIDDLKFYHAS